MVLLILFPIEKFFVVPKTKLWETKKLPATRVVKMALALCPNVRYP